MKSLFFFIYLFHMPAFIFIAGLFSKNTIKQKKYDKVLGYFILYIFLKVLFFVTKVVITGTGSFNLLSEGGIPWFAFAIAVFYLLTMFFQQFESKYVLISSIILACFAGYDESIGDFLVLSRIIVFYPFFYLGFCLNAEKILEKVKQAFVKIFAVLIIFFTAYICIKHIDVIYWIRPLLSGRNAFSLLQYSEYGCVLRLLCYVYSLILIFALISIIPNKQNYFSTLGTRTIQVYALHYIGMSIWYAFNMDAVMQIIWPEHWKILTVLGAGGLITIIFSSEIFSKFFKLLLNPPKIKI